MVADKTIFGTAYSYKKLKKYTDWFLKLPIRDDAKEEILCKDAVKAMKLDASRNPTSW